MKKWLSMIILAAMILGLPTRSWASEETITQDSQEKSGNISIDYSARENYIVTIPASVTFTDTEKTVERPLQVSDVVLDEGSSLYVYVTSQNGFKMKNGDAYINYKLMVNYNTTPDAKSYNILTVYAGEGTGLAVLTFSTDLQKKYASFTGKYTDTLTFTVSVE